jgi:hypothetical protein
MIVLLYYIFFTTNIINKNNRNIQLKLEENNKNIILKLDENNNNIQIKLDENNNNNKVIFDELNFRLDKLIFLNNKNP